MVVDLASLAMRLALSADFQTYLPVTDLGTLQNIASALA
jgi:hypothetical protein